MSRDPHLVLVSASRKSDHADWFPRQSCCPSRSVCPWPGRRQHHAAARPATTACREVVARLKLPLTRQLGPWVMLFRVAMTTPSEGTTTHIQTRNHITR